MSREDLTLRAFELVAYLELASCLVSDSELLVSGSTSSTFDSCWASTVVQTSDSAIQASGSTTLLSSPAWIARAFTLNLDSEVVPSYLTNHLAYLHHLALVLHPSHRHS